MISTKHDVENESSFLKACEACSLGDLKGGLAIFHSLEQNYPNNAHLKFLIAAIEYELGDYKASREKLEESILLDCNKKQVNHLLGNVYREMRLFELAIEAYEKEVKLNPKYPDVLNDMGIALYNLNRLNEALQSYEKAHQIDKGFADPYHNKAIVLIQQKNFIEAEESLKLAIKLKPKNFAAISTLANLKKYICDFESGWDLYKYRFEFELSSEKKIFTKPAWVKNLNIGKKVFLYGEQGIGDQILFGTMLKEALKNENEFIVSIDNRLISIFKRSFSKYKNVNFISNNDEVNESSFDCQIAMGDLGKYFRKNKRDFENFSYPYFLSNKKQTFLMRSMIRNHTKIIVGISWKSSSNKMGLDKSFAIEKLIPILNLDNFLFVDLQYGDTLEEHEKLKNQYGITLSKIDEIDNFNDIDGLASLIDACDFVVTTSNVTAHLAGALDKKTYLIVPYAKGRCWYWHDGLKQSLWYPSVEIFTQTETGDWSVPINEIKEKIVEEILHD